MHVDLWNSQICPTFVFVRSLYLCKNAQIILNIARVKDLCEQS